MILFRIKRESDGLYWAGNSWSKYTGNFYSTHNRATTAYMSPKLSAMRNTYNMKMTIVETNVEDIT